MTSWWRRWLGSASPSKTKSAAGPSEISQSEVSARRANLSVTPGFDQRSLPVFGETRIRKRSVALDHMPAGGWKTTSDLEALQADFALQLDRFTGVIAIDEDDENDQSEDFE